MARFGSFFVALCMVAIAAAVASLAFLVGGLALGTASAFGLAVLLALVIGEAAASRARERETIQASLTDLSRVTQEIGRDVGELARRVDRFETMAIDKARAATQPIEREMGELGALVKQFAETLQVHEAAILRSAKAAEEPARAPVAAQVEPVIPVATPPARRQAQPSQRIEPPRPAPPPVPELPAVFAGMSREEAVLLLAEAVEAGRMDLFLQPVVTLPQRKVKLYQASLRLRLEGGESIAPEDYAVLAREGGLGVRLDGEMLTRTIQVTRRLMVRNREVGLISDISAEGLADPALSEDLIASLDANRSIAKALHLGIGQATLRGLGAMEDETLRRIAEFGFRFALEQVEDLRLEPRDLADRGFRLVKVHADLMARRAVEAGASIHPADLAQLFARYGIDLIVGDIETEQVVIDLLDHDVKLAQGNLFSGPRPVRAEVLNGVEPKEAPPLPPPAPARPMPGAGSIGAAALAAGAVAPREPRRAVGPASGLRALIREKG